MNALTNHSFTLTQSITRGNLQQPINDQSYVFRMWEETHMDMENVKNSAQRALEVRIKRQLLDKLYRNKYMVNFQA